MGLDLILATLLPALLLGGATLYYAMREGIDGEGAGPSVASDS